MNQISILENSHSQNGLISFEERQHEPFPHFHAIVNPRVKPAIDVKLQSRMYRHYFKLSRTIIISLSCDLQSPTCIALMMLILSLRNAEISARPASDVADACWSTTWWGEEKNHFRSAAVPGYVQKGELGIIWQARVYVHNMPIFLWYLTKKKKKIVARVADSPKGEWKESYLFPTTTTLTNLPRQRCCKGDWRLRRRRPTTRSKETCQTDR